MDNKRCCWFFGDSFTQCLAFREGSPYSYFTDIENKDWPSIVSKSLKCKKKNFAVGGNSNQTIIFDCYEKMSKMKPGDYCIVGSSPSTRINGYDKYQNKIGVYNNDSYQLSEFDGYNHQVPLTDKKKYQILMDYITNFVMDYSEKWDLYWAEQYKIQEDNLQKIGVNTFFWTIKEWSKYETIKTHTNGQINDDHWGVRGNLDFSQHVLKSLNL